MSEKCLIAFCEEEANSRGLCRKCYVDVKRLIKDKVCSPEEAEENGLILPKFWNARRKKLCDLIVKKRKDGSEAN